MMELLFYLELAKKIITLNGKILLNLIGIMNLTMIMN
nr:MAG TPA: hypothetical protein [Caudoviricetes sp.]